MTPGQGSSSVVSRWEVDGVMNACNAFILLVLIQTGCRTCGAQMRIRILVQQWRGGQFLPQFGWTAWGVEGMPGSPD